MRTRDSRPRLARWLRALPVLWLLTAAPAAFAAPPELDTDPFRPPPGREGATPTPKKETTGRRWWFVRPSVGFVERFAPDRTFVPREGFGFALQAGAVLGTGTLRLALAATYEYVRFAREKEIYVASMGVTSCTDVRSVSHHLATASALGWAEFKHLSLWLGVTGGFAYAQLKTPVATADDACGFEEGSAPAGTLGPDFGIAYRLRRDLWLGVYVRYRHFFTKRLWTSEDGDLQHRYFHPLLATGVQITLRF